MAAPKYGEASSLDWLRGRVNSGKISVSDIRADYMRVRKTVKSRQARVASSEFVRLPNLEILQGAYSAQSKLTDAQVLYAYRDVVRAYQAETSTITGLKNRRDRFIASVTARYPGLSLDKSNYVDFMIFLDVVKSGLDEDVISPVWFEIWEDWIDPAVKSGANVREAFEHWRTENISKQGWEAYKESEKRSGKKKKSAKRKIKKKGKT